MTLTQSPATLPKDRPGRLLRWGRRAKQILKIIRRAGEIIDALEDLEDRIRGKRDMLKELQRTGRTEEDAQRCRVLSHEICGMEDARYKLVQILRSVR